MQTLTEEPPRTQRRENYTPGYTQNAIAFMSGRTLDTHAEFVLPLLDRGLEVLDAGCGPGTITQGIAQHVLPGRVTGLDLDPAWPRGQRSRGVFASIVTPHCAGRDICHLSNMGRRDAG